MFIQKPNPNKPKKVILAISLVFLIAFLSLTYHVGAVSISSTVDGIDLKAFAKNRNTANVTIHSNRGTIYDRDQNALAIDADSYTVIAILSDTATKDPNNPRHVVDKANTAKALAPLINMSEERILKLLNKDLYQIELGPGGRGLSQIQMNEIKSLNLPGITFSVTPKRYYPYGSFASYELGYAKNNGDLIVGELGLEKYFNEQLTGINGYVRYEKDRYGFKIPNTPEERVEPKSGYDVHTTIDRNIQIFVENALSEAAKMYNPESLIMVIADAKTGQILASSTRPTFNPNIKDIKNWTNNAIELQFEPGSTMKIYTYAAAIDMGLYNGNDTFKSGQYEVIGGKINDWKKEGWGVISYDEGFYLSSNVGVANLVENYIKKDNLLDYFKRFGFGAQTGITLPNEAKGMLNFKYPIEIVAAGYGQGITTTAIQHIQALTAIANDGKLIQPYIVDKIVNPTNNEVLYEHEAKETEGIIKPSTAQKMRELMYGVTHSERGTGKPFKVDSIDLIAKTGTAQIADTVNGGYLKGENNVIYSFSGMFPKDNPEIIIYTASIKPATGGKDSLVGAVKSVVENITKYLNLDGSDQLGDEQSVEFTMDSYLGDDVEDTKYALSKYGNEIVVIGNGNTVINHYPEFNNKVMSNEKIYLLTDGKDISLPNFWGYSKRDLNIYSYLSGIEITTTGIGYVKACNLPEETIWNAEDSILECQLDLPN